MLIICGGEGGGGGRGRSGLSWGGGGAATATPGGSCWPMALFTASWRIQTFECNTFEHSLIVKCQIVKYVFLTTRTQSASSKCMMAIPRSSIPVQAWWEKRVLINLIHNNNIITQTKNSLQDHDSSFCPEFHGSRWYLLENPPGSLPYSLLQHWGLLLLNFIKSERGRGGS